MRRHIYFVFFVFISIGSPLYPIPNWNLLLDRQVPTNRYGYEFNGQQGIQDEELIPDPNGNKLVDISEITDVLFFILDKSFFPYQVYDAINRFESDELEKYIDPNITFIRKKELAIEVIEQLSLKLEQYSKISGDHNISEIERNQLAAEIARLGYQVDLNNGTVYLADNTILTGNVVDWAGELTEVNRCIILELKEDYKVNNVFGYFFIPIGTKLYIDLERANIDFISGVDNIEPEFYDLEGEKVGFVDLKDAYFSRYNVIYQENLDTEISGINFYDISSLGISQSEYYRGSHIEADQVRIFNQDVQDAIVFFDEYFNVISVSSSKGFVYSFNSEEVLLESIGFYSNGDISSAKTKQRISISWINGENISIPEGTRIYYYPNGNIKSIIAASGKYFRLDLELYNNSIANSAVDKIQLSDTGDIERVEFVNREQMTVPVLGSVYVRKIDHDAFTDIRLIDFYLHEPKEISLPNSDLFHIERGLATLKSGTLLGIIRAKAPLAISLPDEYQYTTNDGNDVTLRYFESGDIKSLSVKYYGEFNLKLPNGEQINAYNVKFYQNGIVKQVYCSSQQVSIEGIGSFVTNDVSFSENGNIETVVLSAGQTFNYRIGGSLFLFTGAILFHEDGSFKASRLAASSLVSMPDGNKVLLPINSNVSFFDDGKWMRIKGFSDSTNISLPNGGTITLRGTLDSEVEYFQSGQVKQVLGLQEPYVITFPNGASATAYYMMEYDEQGNILGFY